MRYKKFGKTGLEVSEICLGTWGIGGAGWDAHSDEERMDAIKAALDCGINFIDTAPAYNAGRAEQYIGETLYLVHWPDPNVSMEETIGAVAQLKKEGKILHAGVSNFTKEQIEEAGKYCEIEAYQPQYSMLDGDNEAVIRWAAAQDMGIMSYGTFGGGILTGTYREVRTFGETDNRNRFYPYFREPLFSKVMELLEVMDAIAAERGVPLAQIAVNWTLQQPFITSCIAGAQSRKKVEENCAGLEWQLTEDEMHRLDQAIQRYQFPVQCGEVYQRR